MIGKIFFFLILVLEMIYLAAEGDDMEKSGFQ